MPFSKQWRRDDAQSSKPQDATLSYYIRNSIHHPENRLNDAYSQDELKESTEVLVKVLQTLKPNSDHSHTTEQNKDL